MFGELAVLKKANILNCSTLMWKNDNLYQMNQVDKRLRNEDDLWVEAFFRTYSDCILTTMSQLKRDPLAYMLDSDSNAKVNVGRYNI